MVSTRQMATSSIGNCGSNATAGSGHQQQQQAYDYNSATAESVQLSVVTRHTASNYVLENCSTIPQPPGKLALSAGGGGPSGSLAASSSRHLTQAVKASGSGGAGGNSATATGGRAKQQQVHLFDLPEEILRYILTFVSYKSIGQLRLVSPQLNNICMHILNSTFTKLITQTYSRFNAIKANMPRRESARRNHPLACECDIIETCYMRLSLLQMTFGKHIERGHCCFFPAAILDEVYTIQSIIKNNPRLERPYRVTDELFDLSTMAMEYFRDRIEPQLPEICYFNKDFFKLPTTTKRAPSVIISDLSDSSSSSLPSPPQSNMVLRKGIRKIKQGMKIYNNQLSVLRNELRTCKRKAGDQAKQIAEQQKLMAEQQKQTLEYANRLDENDKKNEEMSRKFSTLLQELNKCKTELQYWRSKSPAIPACTTCGQRVTPLLPPEDYQALVNQGVKPEDILSLNDDTDVDGDIVVSIGQLGAQFAQPDEVTTAKLLAVNTAAKNLKRQHAASTITSTLNTSAAASGSGAEGGGSDTPSKTLNAQPDGTHMGQPSQMTNCVDFARRGNIITLASTKAEPTLGGGVMMATVMPQHQLQQGYVTSCDGYSTKLFYGAQSGHKGVIVSPPNASSMMASRVASEVGGGESGVTAAGVAAATEVSEVASGPEPSHSQSNAVEDVASLQAIASHETKKARRVQKATRCLNGSGKRSK